MRYPSFDLKLRTRMKNKPFILLVLLWPFSVVYGIVVYVRNWLFDRGILPSEEFDLPVIPWVILR